MLGECVWVVLTVPQGEPERVAEGERLPDVVLLLEMVPDCESVSDGLPVAQAEMEAE